MASLDLPPPFAANDNEAPPSYENQATPSALTSRPLRELAFSLENSKGKPWATLKVLSRANQSAQVPSFLEGEDITGMVELKLEKTEHIQAVTVEVHGDWTAVGQDPIPFLFLETTLWSTSMGNPSSPKLKGDFVWPFKITLPETVKVPTTPGSPLEEYRLPPNFSERAAPCYLEYKITVRFRRGKLRIDNVLFTSLAYLPRTRPDPASELRRLAYREKISPPGPEIDIHGWHNLGTKAVTGTVFDSRQATLFCTLYLAEPLSYTRGTTIPVYIHLQCSDKQALDLCSTRGSLTVTLARTLYMQSVATAGADFKANSMRSNKVFASTVGKAIYWPAEDNDAQSDTRKLEGEIPVRVDLKPTFIFPNISIKYHVSFAITAPGFTTSSEGIEVADNLLFTKEVQIASILPIGPVARSRIPAAELKKDEGNYDVSIGMLTAANQRFIHYAHHG